MFHGLLNYALAKRGGFNKIMEDYDTSNLNALIIVTYYPVRPTQKFDNERTLAWKPTCVIFTLHLNACGHINFNFDYPPFDLWMSLKGPHNVIVMALGHSVKWSLVCIIFLLTNNIRKALVSFFVFLHSEHEPWLLQVRGAALTCFTGLTPAVFCSLPASKQEFILSSVVCSWPHQLPHMICMCSWLLWWHGYGYQLTWSIATS